VDQNDEPLGGIDTSTSSEWEQPPQDVDLDAWLGGARPVRRSITLYARGDLIGRLEQLVTLIEQSEGSAERAELEAEAEQVQAAFLASGQVFTIEARSSEWVDAYRADCVKRLGLKLGPKTGTMKDQTEYFLRMLAEQIVVPSGMTYERLKRLAEISEPDVKRLIQVLAAANTEAAAGMSVVTRDFSQGRSGAGPR
jgi:hypothetical protein